jgi:CubicO group peptidase (beta-lactamase class C family)
MAWDDAALDDVASYAQSQKTTGLLVIQDRAVVLERNWPLPPGSEAFLARMTHGVTAEGALLEDVASQQKSFVGVLIAIGVDKGLIDIAAPVSNYLGSEWTKADAAVERAITVRHLMDMTSGLTEAMTREAAPDTRYFYNTPAYAQLKPVLEKVSGSTLEELTQAWLAGPAGMADTGWRQRPAELAAASGNATGLATTPRDVARMGQMVLDGGLAADGTRIVSEAELAALFTRTPVNPSYGRLWWVNDGAFAINPQGVRTEGRFVPAAPTDTVLALGAAGRSLGVSPSRRLIVVRLGQQPDDPAFLGRLWSRAMKAAPAID